ncbi:MAG TPA: hypothetical protein VGR38_12655 [Candidatus Polarisedimenticolia bacterium]|nr:hypothetical protein [Candidatus Polarisedimenticolia bacterium]
MRIVIGPPSGAEIRGYVVELSWLDHENERWSESSRALTRILRGSVARETLPYEWFSRAAAGRDRWRLRARSLEPPGEWSGWIEFQVAGSRGISRATPLGEVRRRGESSPPPGDRGTALTLPPSMRRPPPTRERRPAGAEEGRSSSTGPARRTPSLSSLLRSATGDSSTNAKIAPKLPTPEVKAWTWNAVKQEGAWVNLLSLSQAETVQLRWKPVQKKAEAGHWELRAGPKTGTFESAQVIHDGLIEMPGPGQEWRAFQVDLSQYPVKGSPRRYVAVRQAHFPTSAPVEIRVGEPSKLAHLLGSVKVASVDTPAWVVEGPAGSSPTFQPGNHVKVVFDYQLLKPFGGRIYPILLDENDRVSSRNYWEASEPLQGTQGKASSRMTLKCPDSMSPVARVGSILYTVTDASGKEAFKGVAPLPHLLVFRCKFSPARDDRTEILVAAPPHPSSGSLPVTMTFHSTPDCNCDYGRFNLEYPVYRSVKQGETVRLFSYLLREDGKPVRDKNQCGSDIPEHNGYGFELTGGKLSGTLLTSHGDAVYCRPPTTPGWGPIYKIKGLRVELRKHPGWNMCQNPESMPLLASDTLPLDLTVVCK